MEHARKARQFCLTLAAVLTGVLVMAPAQGQGKARPPQPQWEWQDWDIGRNVSCKPRFVGGVKGHDIEENTLPGSDARWAGIFK